MENPELKVTLTVKQLEELIRKVVREEIARVVAKEPDVFYLDKDSPLYSDMVDILERKKRGQLKFHTHKEIWSEWLMSEISAKGRKS